MILEKRLAEMKVKYVVPLYSLREPLFSRLETLSARHGLQMQATVGLLGYAALPKVAGGGPNPDASQGHTHLNHLSAYR